MAERVYIETTVVSYLTARPNRDVVIAGHQQITHDWWDTRRQSYELCVSQLVLDEAGVGDAQAAEERLLALRPMLILETTAEAWNWRRNCFKQEPCQRRRPMMRCTSRLRPPKRCPIC